MQILGQGDTTATQYRAFLSFKKTTELLFYMDRSGQLQAMATLTPYENACSTK
jgi:hypothetical protein